MKGVLKEVSNDVDVFGFFDKRGRIWCVKLDYNDQIK